MPPPRPRCATRSRPTASTSPAPSTRGWSSASSTAVSSSWHASHCAIERLRKSACRSAQAASSIDGAAVPRRGGRLLLREAPGLVDGRGAGPLLDLPAVVGAPVGDVPAPAAALVCDLGGGGVGARLDREALGAGAVVGVLLHLGAVGGRGRRDVDRLAAVGVDQAIPALPHVCDRELLSAGAVALVLLHLRRVGR